ncbi:MAG: LuxR family transcriptional regulator [Symbiobacteriaceae bacterium]|jgi:DNA-binding CsgD family transcriptional regulator|nr:LuxR family transcriptional regulator [Symbiobacteriaceae bacterium]
MMERLGRLSPPQREMLEMAALAGSRIDLPILCRASGESEETVVQCLEAAVGVGLMCEEAGQLVFAPGVRAALYGAQLGIRRALRHRKWAQAASDPDEQAWHLGEAGDTAAVPLLRAAGDRAMVQGERLRAWDMYRRAIALSEAADPALALVAAVACSVCCEGESDALLARTCSAEEPAVRALGQYFTAVRATGGDAARELRAMDQAHKGLAALWRDPALEELLALTTGRRHQVAGAPGGLGLAYLRSGRPQVAEAVVREALIEGGASAQGPLDHWVLAEVAALRGDLSEAFTYFALSVEDALARKDYAAAAGRAEAWLALLAEGRGAYAGAEVTELRARVGELERLAAEKAGGSPRWDGASGAEALPRGAEPRYGEYRAAMEAMTAAARACTLAGDLPGARMWLERVDAWHAGPRPSAWCFALNRVEWARWHAAAGDESASRRAAEEALELGLRFGAEAALVEPARALLGETPSQPAAAPGLTRREAEIAALVARGLTDREVGERLFISPRTVDGHLRNIFRKLDLPSRTALGVWAARAGLLEE